MAAFAIGRFGVRRRVMTRERAGLVRACDSPFVQPTSASSAYVMSAHMACCRLWEMIFREGSGRHRSRHASRDGSQFLRRIACRPRIRERGRCEPTSPATFEILNPFWNLTREVSCCGSIGGFACRRCTARCRHYVRISISPFRLQRLLISALWIALRSQAQSPRSRFR